MLRSKKKYIVNQKQLLLLCWLLAVLVNANGQNLNNPNKRGPLGTQVNTFSGNLFIPRTDIYVPAQMLHLNICFYYNSFLFTEESGYGKGWSFEYNIRYRHDTTPGGKFILWGDGREDKYDSLAGGGYKTPRGFFNSLSQYQPGKLVITELDGRKFYFDNPVHKHITKMEEPNGNYINFIYTDSLLSSITNAAGQTISFTYTATGRLATVVDAIVSPTRTYTYTYDAVGNLTQVKDPLNGKYNYTYLTNGPMKSLADKNDNKVDIIYYPDMTMRELVGCNKRLSFSYDTTSKTTIVTDYLPAGNQVTKYKYATFENIAWMTSMSGNCCGFNMSFEFDQQGNKIKETDANGNVHTYTYDDKGNMLTMTDPMNGVSTYGYAGPYNHLSSYTDPNGNIYNLQYDAKGNLTQLTAPGNQVYTATYNSVGNILTSTDPKGNVYTYNYDAFGNPATVTGPNSYSATLSYDGRGNLLSFTDARSNTHTAEYDILNRLKKITDPNNHNSQFNYDAAGNTVNIKNKEGEDAWLSYDASNRLVKVKRPMNQETFMSYDGMDNLLTMKNALGNTTSFSYDNRNRLKTAKDPLNHLTGLNYDGSGNITSAVLPNGQTINYTYDKNDRLLTASDMTGIVAKYTYDKNGNIASYTNGTGAVTTATYDNRNRLTTVTDALGNTSSYTYDANGNVASITDRNGKISSYTYDGRNRVKTYTDNNGNIITASYDGQGNVTELKDQNNNSTLYTYDNLNRLLTTTYPDGKFIQYGYDKKNNITSALLTDGTTINYQYDSLNRMVTKTLPGGHVYNFGYDVLGRVTSASNNSGTVTITYDALNRITSETFDGRTINYQYNIAGRTQTTIYPDSTVVTKNFDTRNRLTSVARNGINLVSYEYNGANQTTVKTFGNGVISNLQYDVANRLNNLSTSSGAIQNSSFSYDKEMNKTAINRLSAPEQSEQFTYDNGYRLLSYKRGSASPDTYSYDAVGNRTSANINGVSMTYTKNNLNQLTSVNGVNLTYDNRGNLTFDGTFYKSYDAENRLLKDSSSPTSIISYAYDALGRRVVKTINSNPFKYSYAGFEQIEERDGNTDASLNRMVFTNFLTPIVNDKGGSSFFYHQNELNSVEAITNAEGNLIERYQYDVYGKQTRFNSSNTAINSSLTGNRFGFTGQEWDSATNSNRFYFRNYSPFIGTFNQRDLIGYDDGMGMYQYVGNNPANGIDLFGLEKKPCKDAIIVTNEEWDAEVNRMAKLLQRETSEYGAFDGPGQKAFFTAAKDFVDSKWHDDLVGTDMDWQTQKYLFRGDLYSRSELNYYFEGMIFKAAGYSDHTMHGFIGGWKKARYNMDVSPGVENMAQLGYDETPYPGLLMDLHTSINPLASFTSMPPLLQGYGEYKTPAYYRDPSDLPPEKKDDLYFTYRRAVNLETGEVFYKKFKKDNAPEYSGPDDPCPPTGGTTEPLYNIDPVTGKVTVREPIDPNEISGPEGITEKKWVSVKDRLGYTIQFENDTAASAPAKFVRITSPIEPNQEAQSFQLGSFGFNNQTFEIPANTASYYQRLDCRDSAGLFVDITAGYDQINNLAFWEFQSIDPITLLPSEEPLDGFLFLRDTSQINYGKGFVNFSIKPKQTAQTLDTIGARANIVFDQNEAIGTNIWVNTIDAVAPTSSITDVQSVTPNTEVSLHYTGRDDVNGSGLQSYSIYVSDNNASPQLYVANFTGADTTFRGVAEHFYKFYISAKDSVGNEEALKLVDSVRITNGERDICPGGNVTFVSSLSGTTYQWQVHNGTGFTNVIDGGVYSGANTLALTLTGAPSSMYGYEYRCLVNGTSFSDVYILKFVMKWEGSVSIEWENPANWSCNSLPDMNTDVIIPSEKLHYPEVKSNAAIRSLRTLPGTAVTVKSGWNLSVVK